ncbi:recombinase family protein [Mycobacteroides abscessus]|uniref:recombinase family protein n=1 Tax=Mycobacteroides abscessus TaxID=36809 RepID=UPI00038039CD|nr:recombinase family protein [Mycobacteroides abscessus]OLT88527.1 resolvase [Mycobacteroides abscessus subsp. abscessus]PVB42504.1 recombinase family protein [Mycobacteroides abscessus]CPR87446.1 phage Integrase [Mycobacteroides abscessus]CPS57355.1 phage Integrase [Mycobacteroides abscessus]CPY43346.1 phage Integrase [Mycobacteroides abscessus]
MENQPKRALIVTRLSRVTEATTSPERQMEICQVLCDDRGYEVVGHAEDLDVSGSVDPFDRRRRPNIARWLANEAEPFDVIVVYRVDRLTRSLRHLQKLVHWAEDNGKLVVSATEPHFDMTTPFAPVLIALIGTVAQMELEAIRERNSSAARHNIRAGRWRGGQPPWGYVSSNASGEWRLVPCPEQVELINEVAARVLGGEPLQRIAHDLTSRGIPTPKGRTEWNVTPLKRSLTSEAMLGYVMSGDKPLRNDDGSPIIRAEPILSREVFDRVKVELESRSRRGEPTKRSSSLLLRVLYCGVCQLPAYQFNGGSHSKSPRYRCSSTGKSTKCENLTVRMDLADQAFTENLLDMFGDSERLERIWDTGSDHSAELADINEVLEDLTGLLGTGPYKAGTPQRSALDARIAALASRQAELSAEAVRPSGWVWRTTGEMFADWWDNQDTESRNVWLRSMNIKMTYNNSSGAVTWGLDWGDLKKFEEQLKFGKSAQQAVRQVTEASPDL